MKYLDEFRDSTLARNIIDKIQSISLDRQVKLMEVCGTHTMAISRAGIRKLLPEKVSLLSGPGCPVCVTAQEDIDLIMAYARLPGVIVTTFGDMVRVPGSEGSLLDAKAGGSDVRVVYSTLDAVEIARQHPDQEVVFMGIGFETTVPTLGRAIDIAFEEKIGNFSVLMRGKTMPQAMQLLASDPEIGLHGFICPAHVSAIIGARAYEPMAREYHLPCVVTGFEPLDILQGVLMLLTQIVVGQAKVENEYSRVASYDGNRAALDLMDRIFEPCDTSWRGLGLIPGSGLRIRSAYEAYDTEHKIPIEVRSIETATQKACRCGDVLKGKISPSQCSLFAQACTPLSPIGPCMVSSEGSCAAYFRYER